MYGLSEAIPQGRAFLLAEVERLQIERYVLDFGKRSPVEFGSRIEKVSLLNVELGVVDEPVLVRHIAHNVQLVFLLVHAEQFPYI